MRAIATLFALAFIPLPAFAEGYKDNWWKWDYFPDWSTFAHMVVFVFWWLIAAVPALIGAFIIYVVISNFLSDM